MGSCEESGDGEGEGGRRGGRMMGTPGATGSARITIK